MDLSQHYIPWEALPLLNRDRGMDGKEMGRREPEGKERGTVVGMLIRK